MSKTLFVILSLSLILLSACNSTTKDEGKSPGNNNEDKKGEQPSSIPISIPVPSNQSKVFTYSDLPGFSLEYASNWGITVKDAKTAEPTLEVFPNSERCGTGCYRVMISQGKVTLNLMFKRFAGEFVPPICSNQASYILLANNEWDRITHSKGIYYSSSAHITPDQDTAKEFDDRFKFGAVNDEWSYLPNTKYQFCDNRYYLSLPQSKNDKAVVDISLDGLIYLYSPVIIGAPTLEQLTQMDNIVASIKGIE